MSAERQITCDVAIVGGGPAGLAAASELKQLGVASVLVLDREPTAGGVPRHCGHYAFGMREFGRVLRGPEYAARLLARAVKSGVTIQTRTTVTLLERGPTLRVTTPDGLASVSARRVILATGVREKSRAQRLIGGTKPGGVLSTGALQGLVYLDGLVPFRRPVVLGSELVSFSALLTCRHAGIKPVAIIEPGPRTTAWRGSRLLPAVLGIPLMLETKIQRILGRSQVEAIQVSDRDGQTRLIETDGVIVSGQFVPEAPLVYSSHLTFDAASGGPEIDQFMRLSDPDYFAAGNLLRPVETAGWCWSEGRAAARVVHASLQGNLTPHAPSLRVSVTTPALKLVVPQRLVAGSANSALDHLQLRAARAFRGEVTLALDGQPLWSEMRSALPERRILIPLGWLDKKMRGQVTISVVEHTG